MKKPDLNNFRLSEFEGKIIYVGDPMCSWCWGISDELQKLKDHFRKQFSFQILMGGLRPGGGDAWNSEFKNFIKGHWKHVEQRAGKEFGYALFDKEEFNYDTEPPSRAVRVIRDLKQGEEFAFFTAVQKHFYVENEDPNFIEFYKPLLHKINIDLNLFKLKFESEEYKNLTLEDFAYTRSIGVSSYPSVLLEYNNKRSFLSIGYSNFEYMKSRIAEIIQADQN